MIVVTGAAGFIGSCLVKKFNDQGIFDLILVDKFSNSLKNKNLLNKKFHKKIERDVFVEWFTNHTSKISIIYHIGARTDTIESNIHIFNKLNLEYSKRLWKICSQNNIPLIYASSAATYGMGEFGFNDNHKNLSNLKPLNEYAKSKNEFDLWALSQVHHPPHWLGFKFFNIYGPNEYHKKRMSSVILHAFNHISSTGKMNLFRSHNANFRDGEQERDFMYVMDVVDVLSFVMTKKNYDSGIYNLGTGIARTFNDLANSIFTALKIEKRICFIDTPIEIRHKYQYHTKAKVSKLRNIGYKKPFTLLEDGVKDYVLNYLTKQNYF